MERANPIGAKVTSIRQFPPAHPLPDWRNFGVMLRVLLGGNLLALGLALAQAESLYHWLPRYVELSSTVEPLLLLMLVFLTVGRDALWRLPGRLGQALVLLLAGVCAWGLHQVGESVGLGESGLAGSGRTVLLAMAAGALLLAYFDLRLRAYSPAIAEARLAALNARIRPHFLFNSLNAVLSLIRAEPRRAEAALEGLSDLFRAALRDPREMVALSDEIALGRQYLDLEKLRLGERLKVDWQVDNLPLDAPIPPLMLQPLLENAIYHGIEPLADGGVITIGFARTRDELTIAIGNPMSPAGQHASGNQMALANIRERLALYYDLEARLETVPGPQNYLVKITLPCRQRNRSAS